MSAYESLLEDVKAGRSDAVDVLTAEATERQDSFGLAVVALVRGTPAVAVRSDDEAALEAQFGRWEALWPLLEQVWRERPEVFESELLPFAQANLERWHPSVRLLLDKPLRGGFCEPDQAPLYSLVRRLFFDSAHFDRAAIDRLLASPHLERVESLSFNECTAADERWFQRLIPRFTRLTLLVLGAPLADDDLRALASAPCAGTLEQLSLINLDDECRLTDAGIRALAAKPMPRLESLTIAGEPEIDADAMAAALATALWPQLQALTLVAMPLSRVGALALAPLFHRLKRIELPHCELGLDAALELFRLQQSAGCTLEVRPITGDEEREGDASVVVVALAQQVDDEEPEREDWSRLVRSLHHLAVELHDPAFFATRVMSWAGPAIDRWPEQLRWLEASTLIGLNQGVKEWVCGVEVEEPEDFEALLLLGPGASSIHSLSCNHSGMGDEGLQRLLEGCADLFDALGYLRLRGEELSDAGLAQFATASMRRLERLNLADNDFSVSGVQALAASDWCAQLRSLSLSGAPLGQAGAQLLAGAPLPRLEVLKLDRCALGDEGLRSLLAAPYLRGLKTLSVVGCGLSDAGMLAFADAACPNLTTLFLADNDVTAEGVASLRSSPRLVALQEVETKGHYVCVV